MKYTWLYSLDRKQGYISLHNPSEKSQSYHLKLDKALGVPETKKRFKVDSPITNIQERSLSDIIITVIPFLSLYLRKK